MIVQSDIDRFHVVCLVDRSVDLAAVCRARRGHTFSRLQLKRGLFWYGHHPKMHEMVSDRSSRAENWTDLLKFSMRVFFDSNKCGKMIIWSKKHKHVIVRGNKSLRSYTGHTKVGKINLSDRI